MENEVEKMIGFKNNKSKSISLLTFEKCIDPLNSNALYCFVEGYDMCYYSVAVKGTTEFFPIAVRCGGKKNVLELYQLLLKKPAYNKYKKRFFVDADFDDNSEISNEVYVTPGYSIENFYVSDSAIRSLLGVEFQMSGDIGLLNKAYKLFKDNIDKFINAILLFNVWYACIKNKVQDKKIQLGKKFPSKFVKLEINNITVSYNKKSIEEEYPDVDKISDAEIYEKETLFRQNDLRNVIRGKYMIQFLYVYLEFLNKDAKKSKIYTSYQPKLPISETNLISQYCQYADIPMKLKNYIINGVR